MSYSIKFKKEVILFAINNSIKDTRRKFEVYDHNITRWLSQKDFILAQEDVCNSKVEKLTSAKEKFLKQKLFNSKKNIFVYLSKTNVIRVGRKKKYEPGYVLAIDLWKLAVKQKLKCALSGIKLTKENISVDHIIPLFKGGKDHISNIQLVDKTINMMKNALDVDSFISFCRCVHNNNLK